jgi:pimeloyl-ACP methyl ester carboxylesterase
MADDALAVLESDLIGPRRVVHGVAHSMGGAALVLAADRRPGVLSSLWLYEPVLIPSGSLPPSSGDNPMATAAARRKASFASYDDAIVHYASKPPLNELHPDALRAYVTGGFALEPDGTVTLRCLPSTEAAVFQAAATSGAWEVLSELDLPVAVVAGRPEPFGPVTFAPLAVAAMPNATLIERPQLGHFGPLESPSGMAHDVEDWVGSLS